ncbi:MAG: IclR family transcriptional regulator [Comamonas sp.]
MRKNQETVAAATPVDRRQRVQSAETGLAILKALTRLGGSASLTAIAQNVGESTAKVHRYLSSFAQEGFVAQEPVTLHYYLSTESIRLGQAALRQCDPVRLSEPALRRLRTELELTCFVAVMGNLGPTVLRIEEPSLPVTVNIRPGSVLSLLWSATGQAFLAYAQDSETQRKAAAEFAMGTPEQQQMLGGCIEGLATWSKQVREQGVAAVQDLLLRGISAVSSPIFSAEGQVIAVLTVLGATKSFDLAVDAPVVQQVRKEAQSISKAMGYSADMT